MGEGKILDLDEARRRLTETLKQSTASFQSKAFGIIESARRSAQDKLRQGSDKVLSAGLAFTEKQKEILRKAKSNLKI